MSDDTNAASADADDTSGVGLVDVLEPLVGDLSKRAGARALHKGATHKAVTKAATKAPGATGAARGRVMAAGRASGSTHAHTSSAMKTIGATTAATTAGGAAFGAGVEAVQSYRALRAGQLDSGAYAKRVAGGALKGGAASGGRTVAALTVAEGAKQAAAAVGARGVAHAAGSATGTAVAFGVVEQAIDTVAWARGRIDGREYSTRTLQNAGSTGGGLGGAAAGAAAGSALMPGVGTVVGAVVGGVAGGISGALAGRRLGGVLFGAGGARAAMSDPLVARVLADPRAFEPSPPEFVAIMHRDFEIDHRQESTFLMVFQGPGGSAHTYAMVLRFRRFEVDALLARVGGTQPKTAVGRVVGRRVELAFEIGGRVVPFSIHEGERAFKVDLGERVYFDVFKLV